MTEFDRVPPQQIKAEQAVLGAILLDSRCMPDILAILKKEDFYKTSHLKIYEAMCKLDDIQEPIDMITLPKKLEELRVLDECGGSYYLTELVESIPTAANVEYHARIVLSASLKRNIIGLCEKSKNSCYEYDVDPFDIIEKMTSISVIETGKDIEPLSRDLHDTYDWISEKHDNPGISGIKTGLIELDDLTGGFNPGDSTIIAARPSMGKSALVENIILKAAEDKYKIAFFSLENTRRKVTLRFMSKLGRINIQDIKRGKLIEHEWAKLTNLSSELERLSDRIFVDDSSPINVHHVRTKSRRVKHKYGLDLIVVDYMQLMDGPDKSESRNSELTYISRNMKSIAKELDCHIINLSQLSRKCEERQNKRPMLSDLRESGAIEQDADIVISVYRPSYYGIDNQPDEVQVLKNRDGPIGTANVTFKKEWAGFENYTKDIPF